MESIERISGCLETMGKQQGFRMVMGGLMFRHTDPNIL